MRLAVHPLAEMREYGELMKAELQVVFAEIPAKKQKAVREIATAFESSVGGIVHAVAVGIGQGVRFHRQLETLLRRDSRA